MTAENKLSIRQICFILTAYNAVSKILIYPTNMAYTCANDLLFPMLACAILQGIIIVFICGISTRTDKTLFQILEDKVGEKFARAIFFLLALYFLFSALYPALEQKIYVHDVFYETIPSLFVFVPFFAFSIYAGAKKFNNVGRCADVCMPIFAVIIFALVIMGFSECDLTNLLPVLTTPANKLLSGTFASVFHFSDSAFVFLFLGHFKYKRGDVIKLVSAYSLGSFLVILISAIFYGIFGPIAPNTFFAISKIGTFFSAINLVGRIDIMALYILEIVMLFALVLNVQACVYCLEKALKIDNTYILSIASNAILITLVVLFDATYDGVQKFYMSWAWIVSLSFAYVLPLVVRAFTRGKKICKNS